MLPNKRGIEYVRVNADDERQRAGFIAVYKEAFGGPPYNEVYSDAQVVDDAWLPHLQNGVIVLAVCDEEVIGFGCCIPVEHAPEDILSYLLDSKRIGAGVPDIADTWYISELGVLLNHRRRGIGTQLIGQSLAEILLNGNQYYVMRTAANSSNSRHIFEMIGATLIPGLQDVSDSEQVKINQSQSAQRIYLYGSCAHGLETVFSQ